MSVYEAPEILELGKATTLTLGQGGPQIDNCFCAFTPVEGDIP